LLYSRRSLRPPTPVWSYPILVKQNSTGAQARPVVLDEAGFQQLLAAAYVVQQHNDRLQLSRGPGVSYTRTLAEIVETEAQIKNGRIGLSSALRLVVERARKLARAEAAVVAMVEDGYLVYRACSGRSADEIGSRVRLSSAIAVKCMRSGGVLQSPDTTRDKNLDSELCWRKGVRSLLAAPVLYDNKPIGVLELRFSSPNGFREEDARTCELMAGLVSLALMNEWDAGRQRQQARKEEAAMQQALDSITPHLDRLIEGPEPDFAAAGRALSGKIMGELLPPAPEKPVIQEGSRKQREVRQEVSEPKAVRPEPAPAPAPAAANFQTPAQICQSCGRNFVGDESVCGICGMARSSEAEVNSTPQASTWASLWDLQESENSAEAKVAREPYPLATSDAAPEESQEPHEPPQDKPPFFGNLHDIRERFLGRKEKEEGKGARQAIEETVEPEVSRAAEAPTPDLSSFSAVLPEVEASEDTSLLSEPEPNRIAEFWRYHRATIYLAVAAILLLMVLLGWGDQPEPASTGSAVATANAEPDLTLFEKMLVEMGLAEAPTNAAVNPGNPDAKVWADVHTALYYCPGADLYGKTKGGKYTSQKEAQLDHFEPAARRACK